jgi:rhodanese-related sulfurtransferase
MDISPKELKARMDKGDTPFILDIREPREIEICALKYDSHIPMHQLPDRFQELSAQKDKELVVYCRSGGRSAACADFLRQQGFQKVINLVGGTLAWSDQVDTSMPKY